MARRSPMNPRYKKDAQVGVTRKSAASAKPKRASSSGSSSSGSAKKSGSGTRTGAIQLPPETKKLQKYVFIMLGVAVLISAFYLLAENRGWLGGVPPIVGSILIGVSYALLFAAVYIDLTKVRPVTKALRSGQPLPTSKPSGDTAGKQDSAASTWTDWIPMLGRRTKTQSDTAESDTTESGAKTDSETEGKDG